jgi:hypothetical protein
VQAEVNAQSNSSWFPVAPQANAGNTIPFPASAKIKTPAG